MYDLERDPGELANLYHERRQLADRMAAELQKIGAEDASAETGPSAVDPETRERLAALGYIGSFTHTARKEGEALPDPEGQIDIFNLMTSAQESNGKESVDSALDRLRRVVGMDPNILDAWVMLGNEYFRKRDFRLALEQYKRALAIKP